MDHACASVLALALAVGANAPSGHVAASQGLPEHLEYPFGQLSVSNNGTLYYVDRQYGQVDEVTPSGAQVVLSSLEPTAAPKSSIPGLSGLSLTKNAMWFTAANSLYEASPTGRDVRRLGEVPGAVDLEVRDTEPGVRGDTASGGGTKPAVLETGAEVNVPLFVNIGDRIRVDTRSGDYVSRA